MAWSRVGTEAIVRKGSGDRFATFLTEIPSSGRWQVEYYLSPRRQRGPGGGRSRRSLGTWSMTLADRTGSQEISFDADGGEAGWNSLGVFDLAAGEVRFVVSNETDGSVVVADAVRWTSAASGDVSADTTP